jgi:Protein of unknown function (DUF1308)
VVNLDTNAAIAFVSEGSPVRHALKAVVGGGRMVISETARREFEAIAASCGGPLEQARAARLLARVTTVSDQPSPRAQGLRPTRGLSAEDIIILGTGDDLGAVTLTADARAVRAASGQGVDFAVHLFAPVPLTRR